MNKEQEIELRKELSDVTAQLRAVEKEKEDIELKEHFLKLKFHHLVAQLHPINFSSSESDENPDNENEA